MYKIYQHVYKIALIKINNCCKSLVHCLFMLTIALINVDINFAVKFHHSRSQSKHLSPTFPLAPRVKQLLLILKGAVCFCVNATQLIYITQTKL